METTIKIENFRSIESTLLSIQPGLNALVGSNGSGKTNVLQALRFLSEMVLQGAAMAMAKAGGAKRNFRSGTNEIRFTVATGYAKTKYKGEMRDLYAVWRIAIAKSASEGIVNIKRERLDIVASMTEEKFEPIITVSIDRQLKKNSTRIWFADESLLTKKILDSTDLANANLRKFDLFREAKSSLSNLLRGSDKSADVSLIPKLSRLHYSIRRMFGEISSLDEYNIKPEIARNASAPLPVASMGRDGANVSEVIHALEKGYYRKFLRQVNFDDYEFAVPHSGFAYRTYNALKKNNPLPDIVSDLKAGISSIDRISTEIDPSTGRRFVVFFCGENKYRPEEVSDGTIKWLCLLVAVYVPVSRVILLEEPENFMHPWMQQRFVALARERARAMGISVIMSTHSVTVLNALLLDELSIVNQSKGRTTVSTVPNKDVLEKALEESGFGLGDMWVSGGIGGVTGED